MVSSDLGVDILSSSHVVSLISSQPFCVAFLHINLSIYILESPFTPHLPSFVNVAVENLTMKEILNATLQVRSEFNSQQKTVTDLQVIEDF